MKLIFTLIALCFSVLLNAQKAGTPDSSFGVGGISITAFTGYPECNDIALAPDGSFVAAGAISSTAKDGGMCVFKYTHNGLLDTSFGDSGKTIIPLDYDVRDAEAVAVQADGKIVVTGYVGKGILPTIYQIPVVRLNANGSIDSSFGTNGIVIANYNNNDFGYDVTIQPDGKILIEGKSKSSFITLRYLTNGTLDETFGDQGKVITPFSGLAAGTAVVVQQDGKIVAAGAEDQSVALVRYMRDGSLDNSFGINGKVSSHFNQFNNVANDVVLQADGKIIIAGYTESFKPDSALVARYNSNGILDSSFGKNGFTIDKAKFGSQAAKVALESDGKIIIGGYIGGGFFDTTSFLTARFTFDGIIDSSFGINGNVVTNILGGSGASGMVIQNDGKIVLGGVTGDALGNYVALARYNNDTKTHKQIIIQKIKHYIQTHNDAQATTLNTVSIYPNPAQNILHVQGLSSTKAKLTVVDFAGNVKLQAVTNASSYNINIASLHAGNYLLKIETNDAVVTKQFVKE